jgi:hypothetical protein
MPKALGALRALCGEVVAVVAALAVCQAWLLRVVDEHSWYYHPGERHDYLPSGEGPFLMTVEFVAIALAVWIVLRCVRLKWPVSRTAATCLAVPSAIIGMVAFEGLLSSLLPNPMVTSAYAVWSQVVVATIAGALGLDRQN